MEAVNNLTLPDDDSPDTSEDEPEAVNNLTLPNDPPAEDDEPEDPTPLFSEDDSEDQEDDEPDSFRPTTFDSKDGNVNSRPVR